MTDGPLPQPCAIHTEDGLSLEGELLAGSSPIAAAVICHPHPLYGGNMHNNVVAALFSNWGASNVAVLRFNFRGSGRSEGEHGGGDDERRDITAAIAEMSTRYPDIPLLLAGYSFGADTALAVDDERIASWLLVAPPLQVVPVDEMAAGADRRPKVIVTGSIDDFRPPDQVGELTGDWQNTTVVVAEGASHFFATGLDTVTAAAEQALRDAIAR